VASGERVYGVTTGFGVLKKINLPLEHEGRNLRRELQKNVLLSHAAGVGESTAADDPANYFPADVVRATLLVRLNTFLKGHSGVRPELVERIVAMLNEGIIPLVPIRGSLGSSGDLCPLAHLFCTLLGKGRYYVVREPGDFDRTPREYKDAADLTHLHLDPSYKEGLALTNGAAFSAAILALCVDRSRNLANAADIAAAMTLQALCGSTRAMDPKIHDARNMRGQIDSAANLRNLVAHSRLRDTTTDVQDAYSLRCAPAVHGASRDAIAYARMVVEQEINAATDNPLFFPDQEPWDSPPDPAERNPQKDYTSYSGGNFHGQPIALAADFLAIALAEFASISERRTQMLLDAHHNRGLPPNLIAVAGLNSGFMLAQYCAASLVSENKVLAHPASVDSIPTSANVEDHVAMATHAARKLSTVLGNAESVIAIELLAAAQAIEWRIAMPRYADPNDQADKSLFPEPSEPQASARAEPRGPVTAIGAEPGDKLDITRAIQEAAEFEKRVTQQRSAILEKLGRGTRAAYLHIRGHADEQDRIQPMFADRMLDEDIRRARRLVAGGSLVAAVNQDLDEPLRDIPALHAAER